MRQELLELVRSVVTYGTVTLASGKTSDFYVDMRRLTLHPKGAYLAANLIDVMLKDVEYEAVGGLTIGADPIVGAFCYHAYLKNKQVTGFLVRKEAKKHGLRKTIEGPPLNHGARVVLIDDVVTTGTSTEIAYQAVANAGCQVIKALALIDREQGAREKMASLGVDFEAIFTRQEIMEQS